MFVKHTEDQTLIEVENLESLFDPFKSEIQGRQKAGEEEQPLESFNKLQLMFPSGEALPQCWVDPTYQTEW